MVLSMVLKKVVNDPGVISKGIAAFVSLKICLNC